MKSRILALSISVFLILAFIASCNKEETATDMNQGEQGISNNLRTGVGRKTIFALSGSCSAPDNGEMDIDHTRPGEVVIQTRRASPISSHKFKALVFDIPVELATGKLTIPNDGNTYWFIPFDEKGAPQRLKAGGTIDVKCNCVEGGGDCGLVGSSLPGGGSEFECKPNDCNGCCEMVITETNGPSLAFGSGIIIAAERIIFNGSKFKKNDRQFTLASTNGHCTNPGKSEMVLYERGQRATELIVRQRENPNADVSEVHTFILNIPVSDNTFSIPQDGRKYWLIPFDKGNLHKG